MTYVGNSWHRAIAHVDGDAFFASVEQAVKPYLKGKPVVTGKERNIVAAASYEAKALGVKRGVALWEARKMCPGLVVLPTDYETVSLFSKRMFDIMRRYSPVVEEYSVDEGFIDLTGLGRNYLSVWRSPQHQEDVGISPRSASRAKGDRPTDQRRVSGYEMMALDLQQEIKRELDITVSVGLSGSKVLAKSP